MRAQCRPAFTGAAAILAMTLAPVASSAQKGTCGPCPFPGACPPTFPIGAGPGEDHSCENWSNAGLAGFSILGSNMTSTDFTDAVMVGANLSTSDFTGARLIRVDLASATLVGAVLDSTDLSNSELRESDLTDATLIDADLTVASVSNAMLVGADLSGANLSNADLSGSDLTNSRLEGADAAPSKFIGAILDGADLSNVDFSKSLLTNASMLGVKTTSATFDEANLAFAILDGAMANATIFNRADLHEASLVATDLVGSSLAFTDCSNADFSDAKLVNSDLTNATAFLTNFQGADLTNAGGLGSTFGPALYDDCTDFSGTGFDPVAGGWLKGPHPVPFFACTQQATVDLSNGGTQLQFLNAGAAQANRLYFILGSATGTSPGILADNGLTIPLNFDSYYLFTALNPNTAILTKSLGFLNAKGLAESSFNLPPGLSPTLAGVTLNHAYVVLDFLSNPPQTVFARLFLLLVRPMVESWWR